MQRIDTENNSATLPPAETGTETPGYFSNGDPSLSVPGTKISADWLNGIQEELINVMTAAGITPDKSDNAQLLTSILQLIEVNAVQDSDLLAAIQANAIFGTVGTDAWKATVATGADPKEITSTPVEIDGSGVIANATSVHIGADLSSKDVSAALEITSTTKGLLLPRMSTVERNAIASPTSGLIIHDSTQDRIALRGSTGWRKVLAEEPSGAFGFPSLTQTERNALSSPFNGLMIFNSTKRDVQVYRNSVWENVGSPAGSIAPFGGVTAPDGWMICDGSQISRSTYADLFRAIGVVYGVGDGSTTFHLPDFRGRFLRGAALGSTDDPDRASRSALVAGTFTLTASTTNGSSTITVASTTNLAPGMSVTGTGIPASSVVLSILSATTFQLGNTSRASVNATATNASVTLTFSKSATSDFVGSYQSHQLASHNHSYSYPTVVTMQTGSGNQVADDIAGSATTGSTGGLETRPVNLNVNYIVKY